MIDLGVVYKTFCLKFEISDNSDNCYLKYNSTMQL